MAAEEGKSEIYTDDVIKSLHHFKELSNTDETQFQFFDDVLPAEFKRIGAGKSHVDVLGVGSGEGMNDAHLLTLLQSTLPEVSISVDIIEPCSPFREEFKEMVSKNEALKNIPFVWHGVTGEDYAKEVKAKEDKKRFDFIHMVHMLYYVDISETIKFFHSLLKENGKLMIVHSNANSGWDILWKTYKQELSKGFTNCSTSGDVVVQLKLLGLKFEEHCIQQTCDITRCFEEGDEVGERLLQFLTEQDHFHTSFTPEFRAEFLDHLRNKCSVEEGGKIMLNSDSCGIIVHA